MRDAAEGKEAGWCAWHGRSHPAKCFRPGQRYCIIGMTEYQRRRRGATEEEARSPDGWRQGVKHREKG